jgi:hypothetical protein
MRRISNFFKSYLLLAGMIIIFSGNIFGQGTTNHQKDLVSGSVAFAWERWRASDDFCPAFNVYYSHDGLNWTLMWSHSGENNGGYVWTFHNGVTGVVWDADNTKPVLYMNPPLHTRLMIKTDGIWDWQAAYSDRELDNTWTDFFNFPEPKAPSNLSAEVRDGQNIRLSWDNDPSDPYIQAGNNTPPDYEVIVDGTLLTTTTNLNYVITGDGKDHNYKIRKKVKFSVNPNYFYSPYSVQITAKSLGIPVLQTASIDKCEAVDLKWTYAGASPDAFKIYRYLTDWVEVGEAGGYSRSFSDSPPSPENILTYSYKVMPVYNGFKGLESNAVSGGTYGHPKAPENFMGTISGSEINLSWNTGSANTESFQVIRTIESTGVEKTFKIDGSQNTLTDDGAPICEDLSYILLALNKCNTTGVPASTVVKLKINRDISAVLGTLTASKGYHGDKVHLEWTLNGITATQVDQFNMYRRVAGAPDYALLETVRGTASYNDVTAIGSKMYEYKVQAVHNCGGTLIYSNEASDMGFRIPFATVSGKVLYDDKSATEDVRILIEPTVGMVNYSVALNGSSSYIEVADKPVINPSSKLTLEVWFLKSQTQSGTATLFSKGNATTGYGLSVSATQVLFRINNKILTVNKTVEPDVFNQLTAVYDGATMICYLNGTEIGRTPYSGIISVSAGNLRIGADNSGANMLNGNVDHIRLWNIAKTPLECTQNYSRYLGQEEEGLVMYLRMDENFGNKVFDFSRTGGDFNQNDGAMANCTWSTVVPTSAQLGYSAYTDNMGFYQVTSIGYSGAGQNFKVVPFLGPHQFTPVSKTLFLGEGANVISDQDFTDISAYNVSGTVRYKDCSCYVADVMVMVDDKPVLVNGQLVYTDANGFFKIKVPIGLHKITLQKAGHTFENEGAFPSLVTLPTYPYYDFQDAVSGIEFIDNTTYTIIGRVVGGTREGNKKPGLGLSTNNIGTAIISFKAEQGGGCYQDTVHTSASSGEYSLKLPPLRYIISSDLGNSNLVVNNRSLNFGTLDVLDASIFIPENSVSDTTVKDVFANVTITHSLHSATVIIDGGAVLNNVPVEIIGDKATVPINGENYLVALNLSASVTSAKVSLRTESQVNTALYNIRRDFIYRSDPELSVAAPDGTPFTGEKYLNYKDPQTNNDFSIDLETSPFNYDVFIPNKEYEVKVSLFEQYVNYDQPSSVVDRVPVSDASVIINNELSQVYPIQVPVVNGGYLYKFQGGVPNVMRNDLVPKYSYTNVFQIIAQVGSKFAYWKPLENNTSYYRGYVLGVRMIAGTDFVSEGPQVVDFILRDPPGSESSATLSKGFSKTMTDTFSNGTTGGGSISTSFGFGMEVNQTIGVLGNGVSISQTKNSYEVGLSYEQTGGTTSSEEIVTTETFTDTYSTSDSPELAGSSSDLFFGRAKNILFGVGNQLNVAPFSKVKSRTDVSWTDSTSTGYTLVLSKQLAVKPSDVQTHFVYSKYHIENSIIPNLVALRNQLLESSPDYSLRFRDMNDVKYGTNNDDFLWKERRRDNNPLQTNDNYRDSLKSDYSGPSYIWHQGSKPVIDRAGKTDMVRKYNEQIRIWKEALLRNEQEKLTADFEKNISFSAGTNYESEYSLGNVSNYTWAWNMTITANASIAFDANIFGLETGNEINFVVENNQEGSETAGKEETTTIGYSLSDPDVGDYYSVDVKRPKGFGGPVFYIQAGRTSCPNETEELAVYSYTNSYYYRLTNENLSKIDADLTLMVKNGSFVHELGKSDIMSAITSGIKDKSYKTAGEFKDKVWNTLYDVYENSIDPFLWFLLGDLFYSGKFSKGIDGIIEVILNRAVYMPTEKELGVLKLNEGTIQREKPVMSVLPSVRDRVPDDKPAVFTLILGNEADEEGMYGVKIIESSNPYGAIMQVDGTDIEGRLFVIPANGSLTKTLMVSKGSPDVNDYIKLQLMIYSTCDYELYQAGRNLTIADTISLDVHFVPACTDLSLFQPLDKFTVNYSNKTANKNEFLYDAVIDNYNSAVTGLKKIQLQYKPTSSSQWVGLQTWWKNPADILQGSPDLLLPDNNIGYKWDVTQLPDQAYELRAVSTCALSENYTLPITGLMDRVNPTPFGSPQPADGILSAGEEVVIQFNEPVFAGGLTYSNFDLRGILNGTGLRHGTSIALDGDETKYAVIPEGINFAGKSFTIETWFRRGAKTEQCLVSQGNAATNGLWMGFDNNGYFTFNLNGLAISTDYDPAGNDAVPSWHHLLASYNSSTQVAQLFVDGFLKKIAKLTTDFKATGRIIVGKRNYLTAIPSNGELHELRIWYDAQSLSKIAQNMNLILNGKERGLAGNWRFDEAYGNMSRDYSASRNATIFGAQWKLDPSGDALHLNGSASAVAVSSSDIAFGPEENFTIEFWFKGSGNSAQTLFSNGKGDGTDTNINGWSLTSDASGKMIVSSHGTSFTAADTNQLDNKWHHFALVVNRLGNITAFIDGNRKGETPAENWAEFGGPQLYIGALADIGTGSTTYSNFFNGDIDEFRVWTMARKQDQIKATMNYMMEGDEPGLILYLPFETYTESNGIYMKTSSLKDLSVEAHPTTTLGVAAFTSNSASIKLPRPLSKVNFNWVTNEDKILLDITDPSPLIENCILDAVVKDVKDLHENIMQSPATWSFFVNLNQMIWSEQEINLRKEVYREMSFTAEIKNIGGSQQTYKLENLPSWLKASPSAGTIEPLKNQIVTFTVSQGVNLGKYNENIYLSTDLGFSEKLPVNLSVYKPEPDWKVNPSGFQYSMSIIGQLSINGIISTDDYDIVGVFSGDECRGVVHLVYVEPYDRYLAYLDIYSNKDFGDSLLFKVWDASEGKIITRVLPLLVFENNNVMGTPSSPVNIVAEEFYQALIPLNGGWNWISFNLVSPDLNTLPKLLNSVAVVDKDLIKGQQAFDIYSSQAGSWAGSLTSNKGIVPGKMYMLKTSASDTIRYEGPVADAKTPLALHSGWNWLGYLPQVNLTPAEAFSTFNPSNNDVVKSQYQFSLFDKNLGWIGSLSYMVPGYGYMYRATSSGTLIYPSKSLAKSGSSGNYDTGESPLFMSEWANYPNNMSVVAILEGSDGKMLSGDYVIRAETTGKNIGMARTINEGGKSLYFLTIFGPASEDSIKFAADDGSGKLLKSRNGLMFRAESLEGTFEKPFIIKLSTAGIGDTESGGKEIEPYCYPNPFRDLITLVPGNIFSDNINVDLLDITGKTVYSSMFGLSKVNASIKINLNHIPGGYYILRITDGTTHRNLKLVRY